MIDRGGRIGWSAALRSLRAAAPRLCREAGLELPDALLLDGLPEPCPGPPPIGAATPQALPELVAEWVSAHPDRKRAGLYLTPAPVARDLLEAATGGRFRPRRVLDPAVGAGVFLLVALERWGPDVELLGVDCDPMAVAATRLGLWLTAARLERPFRSPSLLIDRIRWADALFDTETWGSLVGRSGVDLVCGNPPFGNGIEKRTGRSAEEKAFLKRAFPEAARGPYDRSVLFVQLSARLLGRRGRVALLVPRALLAARYAAGLREWLAREAPLTDLFVPREDTPVPDAGIALVGLVARRGGSAKSIRVVSVSSGKSRRLPREILVGDRWGGLLHPLARLLETSARRHPMMKDLFEIRAAATVSEAYRLAGQIHEGGDGWRFLTAGLLSRYGDRWPTAPARHLGRRFSKPILPLDAPALSGGRRRLYMRGKIIVAGLSRVLKARCDANGRYAGGVGTLLVAPATSGRVGPRLLRRGTLLLNSAWLSTLHRCRCGPMSLAGGALPLGRKDIEALPFPSCLAGPAARITRDEIVPLLCDPEGALTRDSGVLLAILDAAFRVLSVTPEESWDRLVQRVILTLAGCNREEQTAILADWFLHARKNIPSVTAKRQASTVS